MKYALFVELIADYAVIPVILIGGWALLRTPKKHRYQVVCRAIMAGLTALLFAKLLSLIYEPATDRPHELLGVVPGASYLANPGFPSDHALFVVTVAATVWFETRRMVISAVLVGLAIVVCVGRVLAFVHTPLDVIAGAVIAVAASSLWCLRRGVVRRSDTKHV